jgi:hypothetical protein
MTKGRAYTAVASACPCGVTSGLAFLKKRPIAYHFLEETTMYPGLGLFRSQYTRALQIAALLVFVALGLSPSLALAQQASGSPDRMFTSGPFQLHDGEHVTFGLLVPAVRNARSNAQFSIQDSAGNQLFSYPPDPGRTFLVSVTYHAIPAGGLRGPSFEISHGIGNPDFVPAGTDGVLIGWLVPAVQRNGQTLAPAFASMQSFNANGGTMTHSYLNGYVVPGTSN